MSDTIRVGATRDGKAWEANNRRKVSTTERKPFRRITTLKHRADTRMAIANGTPDDAPRPRRTGGWLTH